MLVPEEMETILAIARFGGLAPAAEHLHASQSTVTYRLQSLEKKLGQRLVERARGSKRTTMTAAGTRFLTVADRWEELVEDTKRIKSRHSIPLRIGASDAINIHLLPRFHQHLVEDTSSPQISIESGTGPWICDQVALQHIDMGFVFFDRVHSDLLIEPVATSNMVLVRSARTQDPAPNGQPLSVKQLPAEREIRLRWGPDFEAWSQRLLGTAPMANLSSIFAASPLLRAPGTWAVVAAFTADHLVTETGCTLHPLLDEPPVRVIYKVTNRRARAARTRSLIILEEAWEAMKAELIGADAPLTWR